MDTGTRVAVDCIRVNRAAGLSVPGPPAFCSISAATAATFGAAALVPKKFGRPLPSESNPKNVVSTPSAPVICGTKRTSGVPR